MPSLTVQQARAFILSRIKALPQESVPVQHAARRVLAQDIASPADIPAYTNSAMDGFALRCSALAADAPAVLRIAGEALAGHPFTGSVKAHETIRITTGAAVPAWADAVIPFEKVVEENGAITLQPGSVRPGANIRRQGELLRAGDAALSRGRRLSRADAAFLASLGIASVPVARSPVVSLLITGDELVAPGEPCPSGKIYDANSLAVQSLIESAGGICQNFGILADDPQVLRETLEAALAVSDMIILSGGAADSKADFSHRILSEIGSIEPWTVNMRPGRPMRFARIKDTPAFILPGNPVAAFVTFLEFVRGALLAMQGAERIWPEQIQAFAECDIRTKPGRAEFVRGFAHTEGGRVLVRPVASQSSASLSTLTDCNALIAVDHDETVQAGALVSVQLLDRLIG